jgi:hypothetical protein
VVVELFLDGTADGGTQGKRIEDTERTALDGTSPTLTS